jgi:ankyrin repeat protein
VAVRPIGIFLLVGKVAEILADLLECSHLLHLSLCRRLEQEERVGLQGRVLMFKYEAPVDDSPVGYDAVRSAGQWEQATPGKKRRRVPEMRTGLMLRIVVEFAVYSRQQLRVESGENVALREVLELQENLRGTEILRRCFHLALRNNNSEIVSFKLQHDPAVMVRSSTKKFGSPLHECAYYGNIKMARVLLEHPGWVRSEMVTVRLDIIIHPHIAALSWKYKTLAWRTKKSELLTERLTRQRNMVEFLWDEKSDVRIYGGKYGTMLNAAAVNGDPEFVSYVLDEVGFNVQDADHEGCTAAHLSCSSKNLRNSTDTLDLLIEKAGSADILLKTNSFGRLPIHFACGGQRDGTLEYLLPEDISEIDVNVADNDGWTPLHWAWRQWDVLLIRHLVDHKADVSLRTNDG